MNSCSKDSVWSVYVAMFRQYAEHGKGRALSLQWILVATVLSFGNSSGKFKKREEAQTLKGSVLYSMNALETMIQNIQQKGPRDNITSKRLMSLSDPDRFRIHIQLRISFSQNYSKIFNLSFFTSHFISHSWSTTTPFVILKIWKRLQIIYKGLSVSSTITDHLWWWTLFLLPTWSFIYFPAQRCLACFWWDQYVGWKCLLKHIQHSVTMMVCNTAESHDGCFFLRYSTWMLDMCCQF